MSDASVSLLRRLASGVRGFDGDAASAAGVPHAGAASEFGALLEQATRGTLRSGLPLRLAPGLSEPVDASMLDRLGAAADLAAAEGAERVLVMAGERTFRVDVATRTVIDAPAAQTQVVVGIDGVVRAPTADGRGGGGGTHQADGPARVVRNGSLLRVLAGSEDGAP